MSARTGDHLGALPCLRLSQRRNGGGGEPGSRVDDEHAASVAGVETPKGSHTYEPRQTYWNVVYFIGTHTHTLGISHRFITASASGHAREARVESVAPLKTAFIPVNIRTLHGNELS